MSGAGWRGVWRCRSWVAVGAAALLLAGCAGRQPVEAVSLTGEALRRPEIPAARRAELEADLRAARRAARANPESEDAAIWWGRRLAYLGRYQEAIEVYTRALLRHPESSRLRRHRGHRYITVRRFGPAIDDLAEAWALSEDAPDELEPDGQPNELGVPRTTRRFNIAYHLGLAYYLRGEYGLALRAFEACRGIARGNDDMLVAETYWHVLTLWRLDDDEAAWSLLAPITSDMDVIENGDYLMLLRMFKGEEDDADVIARAIAADGVGGPTLFYGVGAWYLHRGWSVRARAMFESAVSGGSWAAFGFIAAEAELARSGG